MRKIDVHHHMLPPAWVAEVRNFGAPGLGWLPRLTGWTPQQSLEQMDRYDVGTAILTLGLPGVWFGDVAQARRLARAANEYAAGVARTFPGRFGFFATVPMPDVEGSLAEVAYAIDELAADGIWLLTSYGNRWPGDAAFAPLFDELQRRKAVVYLHPTAPACCQDLIADVPSSTLEYLFDTTRAATSLLYSGTLHRCPDVKVILSHAGGAIPVVAGRIAFSTRDVERLKPRFPGGSNELLRKLWFEVATSMTPPTFNALRSFALPGHILFGTDFPYIADMGETVAGLDASDLDDRERELLCFANASALLGRG